MRVTLFILIGMLSFSAVQAKKTPIIYGTIEKVIKVNELPNKKEYTSSAGQHFDIGYMYTKKHILFMPYSVTNGKFVGYIDGDNYVELSESDLKEITAAEKITLPSNVTLPFWDRLGGKLALGAAGVIILIGLFLKVKGSTDEDEDETEKEEPVAQKERTPVA
jgi:hypothetical protein